MPHAPAEYPKPLKNALEQYGLESSNGSVSRDAQSRATRCAKAHPRSDRRPKERLCVARMESRAQCVSQQGDHCCHCHRGGSRCCRGCRRCHRGDLFVPRSQMTLQPTFQTPVSRLGSALRVVADPIDGRSIAHTARGLRSAENAAEGDFAATAVGMGTHFRIEAPPTTGGTAGTAPKDS